MSADDKTRGRTHTIAPPKWRLHVAVETLVKEYRNHDPFLIAFKAIVEKYDGPLNELWAGTRWPNVEKVSFFDTERLPDWWRSMNEGQIWKWTQSFDDKVWKAMLTAFETLASEWGLKAPWGAPLVTQAAVLNVRQKEPFSYMPFEGYWYPLREIDLSPLWIRIGYFPKGAELKVRGPAGTILVALAYDPVMEGRNEFEQRLLRAAREDMNQVERSFQDKGLELMRGKTGMGTHIKWLFERIALKKVPRTIALEYNVGQDAVEEAIRGMSRFLGIELPRNRGLSVRRAG